MYSLILDSSNTLLCVGLAKDDELIDFIAYEAWQRQSEYMMTEISNIFKKNNINPKDISKIICSIGPGSYTGLRIGLTIAKIYAFSLNIPLILLSSLEILRDLNHDSICLINARSNRSYCAIYKADGSVALQDSIIPNEKVKELYDESKYVLCGDLEYLGYSKNYPNILQNMLILSKNREPVTELLSVKPIYLKD